MIVPKQITVSKMPMSARMAAVSGSQTVTNNKTVKITFGRSKPEGSESSQPPVKKVIRLKK